MKRLADQHGRVAERQHGIAEGQQRVPARFRRRAEFDEILAAYRTWRARFCDETGELQPKYRQRKMVASFLRDETRPASAAIPVPKGPVEVW